MRRLTVPFVLAASMLGLVPPAQAETTPGCITRTEYRSIKMGTTMDRARTIVGHSGRLTYSSDFSDGDGWRTVDFRQCGRSWGNSSISFDFEKTEREVWVEDWYCDSYGCEDWGYFETQYFKPFRVTSKYAYWG